MAAVVVGQPMGPAALGEEILERLPLVLVVPATENLAIQMAFRLVVWAATLELGFNPEARLTLGALLAG